MKEFMLIFRLNDTADTKPTSGQIQERMRWLANIAAQNKLVDKGNTLSVTAAKTVMSETMVTDGPFTEIKEFINGYMVVRTESIDEAVALARTSPIFKVGGKIEVREILTLYDVR